jgi:hypothetical protein
MAFCRPAMGRKSIHNHAAFIVGCNHECWKLTICGVLFVCPFRVLHEVGENLKVDVGVTVLHGKLMARKAGLPHCKKISPSRTCKIGVTRAV